MPVHLAHLRLRDFRNYARLDADFSSGFHVLLGDNAQGKTNILEAIYLMATLRSFRGVGGAQMIRHGQRGYFVGGNVVGMGEHEIKMFWSARERNLSLDNRPVKKLAAVSFPTIFSPCICPTCDCGISAITRGWTRISRPAFICFWAITRKEKPIFSKPFISWPPSAPFEASAAPR